MAPNSPSIIACPAFSVPLLTKYRLGVPSANSPVICVMVVQVERPHLSTEMTLVPRGNWVITFSSRKNSPTTPNLATQWDRARPEYTVSLISIDYTLWKRTDRQWPAMYARYSLFSQPYEISQSCLDWPSQSWIDRLPLTRCEFPRIWWGASLELLSGNYLHFDRQTYITDLLPHLAGISHFTPTRHYV